MKKEFIVGLYIGNHATSAYCVPIDNENEGRFVRFRTGEYDNNLHTGVFRLQSGEYCLPFLENARMAYTPFIDFVRKISVLSSEKKNAFKAYIRLVVEAMLANEDCLKLDFLTGDKNFYLGISCPEYFSDKDMLEYRHFFNVALANMSVDMLVREGDAALFSQETYATMNANSLVIDYGENTIDFTLFNGTVRASECCVCAKLGASVIEQIMIKSVHEEGDPLEREMFARQYREAQDIIEKTGCTHIDIDEILRLECRRAKEELYKNIERVANVHFNLQTYIPEGPRCRFDFEIDFSESDVFKDYARVVREWLMNIRVGIGSVDFVILRGGASVMPWFQGMVEDVFDGSEIIGTPYGYGSNAFGIAKYTKNRFLCVSSNAFKGVKSTL